MLEEYKYKIELHAHTKHISRCSEIGNSELVQAYKGAGFDGIVITNHFSTCGHKTKREYTKYIDSFIKDYHDLKDKGFDYGIKVYLGMEIRFGENDNDYLLYGIDEDFIKGIKQDTRTLQEFIPYLRQYPDVIIIQAHPFRDRMMLVEPSLLDGVEVFNLHPHHNPRAGFAAKYAENENMKICTCGTDFHHRGHQALSALLTKKMPVDEKELVCCIRNEQVYKVGKATIIFN